MISQRKDLAEKIYQIGILQQNFVLEKLRAVQLNSLQAHSLNYISKHPATIQRDLARYLGKQQATVTNILKVLEGKGFIYREIPKANERQKNIYLTAEGEKMVLQVQAIFEDLGEQVDKAFSSEEKQQFQTFLKRVEEQLT
ncbi:MarR family transcriptional regulator [Enterococcus pseudoavium]|uniref:MarR family transcriptional regulator n=1 Tax=Enterococcus pseudoavium TaxID=44007 RepID=A0AAE4HZQ9_9ENTE|nr:MarR family transcriptional regulator [Enterococcus pseudoavium]MDT2735537.1 MarR family transcriptional regulator [Enterococcus pseudoavium]MDT2754503.1 MarR family transcriptional regulator [Enterococcus pseudoavium]MDT2769441.1 MarR family transcriptional regulator [Enterococcus pseudoavium]REC31065.1 transcriptional regulator [Enterococcus pseudoavium]